MKDNVPAWAQQMVRMLARENRKRIPDVRWRNISRDQNTAGSWDQDGYCLSVTAGWSKLSQRRVMCHECAHWLADGDGHNTMRFWMWVWRLYRRFKVPIAYAFRWEAGYKQMAIKGYWANRDKRGRRPLTHVKIKTRVSAGPPLEQGNGRS